MTLSMEDIKNAKKYGYEIFGSNKIINTYQPNYSLMEENEITDFSNYDVLDMIGSNEGDGWNPSFHFAANVANLHVEKDNISKEELDKSVIICNMLNKLNDSLNDTDWSKIIKQIQLPDFDDTGLAIVDLKEYINALLKENDATLEDSLGGNAIYDNLKEEIFEDEYFNIYGWLQIMPYALLIHDDEICKLVPLIKEEFKSLNSVNWITFDDEKSIHNWLSQMEQIVPNISDANTCMDIDIEEAVPVIEDTNPLIVKHN